MGLGLIHLNHQHRRLLLLQHRPDPHPRHLRIPHRHSYSPILHPYPSSPHARPRPNIGGGIIYVHIQLFEVGIRRNDKGVLKVNAAA